MSASAAPAPQTRRREPGPGPRIQRGVYEPQQPANRGDLPRYQPAALRLPLLSGPESESSHLDPTLMYRDHIDVSDLSQPPPRRRRAARAPPPSSPASVSLAMALCTRAKSSRQCLLALTQGRTCLFHLCLHSPGHGTTHLQADAATQPRQALALLCVLAIII